MKYIKFFIIFFIMIIITISIVLFGNILNMNNKQNNNISLNSSKDYFSNSIELKDNTSAFNNRGEFIPEYEDPVYEYPDDHEMEPINELKYVSTSSDFFTINALYDNYINLISQKSKNVLKDILSPNYIAEYNITDSNIFNILQLPNLENPKQYYKTNITEMLTTQLNDNTYVYIVKGNCRIVGNNTIFTVQVMFGVDALNKTYYVYPEQYLQDKGINKLKLSNSFNIKLEEIKEQEYNKFNYITKTDVEMANEYFNHYQELINYYPDQAFERLNSEYMQKRFGNKENFLKHLEENKNVLSYMQIDQYKVYSRDDYVDYVCTDKYDNLYIFRQQGGVMRYSVFLDNYTVPAQYYVEEYNKKSERAKIAYNLSKIMNMINTKDYNALYNSLDSTFRENNFKTVEDLKQYIKSNIYNLNAIEIKDYEDSKYEYYVCKCDIINMENRDEKKSANIVIDQEEGMDFKMSFSFNN